MSVALERLLTAFFDDPQIIPGRIWPLNPRPWAKHAGTLLVDNQFALRGAEKTWRLNADRTDIDTDARTWARELLLDCANYALANYQHTTMDLLRGTLPRPSLAPERVDALNARLHDLRRASTTSGLLRHRLSRLGLSSHDLAQGVILPDSHIDAWLTGAVPSPALLLRCAPVLQVSEDVLQETLEGKRDTYVWPLPKPPQDRLGRHGHDQDDEAERD